jgi:hypothetical protein
VGGFTPSKELRTERFNSGAGIKPVDHTANNAAAAAKDTAAAE